MENQKRIIGKLSWWGELFETSTTEAYIGMIDDRSGIIWLYRPLTVLDNKETVTIKSGAL